MSGARTNDAARVTKDGFDRIGPFHPAFVWGAVIVLDLIVVLAILLAVTKIGDKVEDMVFPGGPEWVTF
ncbi:hypothetical protein ASE90_11470 [Sphingomonas sp. Leaf67]|uniref:hypothetical protein n=1 Tax=unclassified Sphingomonas TaxID=196159 RepID=UPI0007008560|nr:MULTISPECIES: hypothetical protein [unclassified Sphingomonas]KQN76128.1 hypothetical protein ASE91_15955 [Sphingomonas sp. Leaf62]KQN82285.1 hypothetical protein ASE90_11470 [Sphingomonas sp. Leaf67]